MSVEVIKTIRGRQCRYLQMLYRVGNKVHAKHGLKSPSYKVRNRPPDPRSMKHTLEKARLKWERRIDDAKMRYGPSPKIKSAPNAEWAVSWTAYMRASSSQ